MIILLFVVSDFFVMDLDNCFVEDILRGNWGVISFFYWRDVCVLCFLVIVFVFRVWFVVVDCKLSIVFCVFFVFVLEIIEKKNIERIFMIFNSRIIFCLSIVVLIFFLVLFIYVCCFVYILFRVLNFVYK